MRRRIGITVLVVLLVMLMVTAVACQERDADGLIKLNKPSNLAVNGSTLSWDSVDNAQEYFIGVNGEEKGTTTNTTYNLAEIVSGYGNFDITVRAYGDGEKYGTSDKSDVFVYRKGNALDTPVVVIDEETKKASWQAIENCNVYEVKVYNGKNQLVDSVETQDTYYVFEKNGEDGKNIYAAYDKYTITVVAKPDEALPQYDVSATASATYINSVVLETPVFSTMTTMLRWNKIENATSYVLRMTKPDGTYVDATTTGTSYQRSKFTFDQVGDYYFTIQAINKDNSEVFKSSDFTEKSEEFKVTKLEGIDPEDIQLSYSAEGKATLSWKIAASSLANNFNVSLKALLANGETQLDSSLTSKTISNEITYVVGDLYDVYNYAGADSVTPEVGATMLVYNMDGVLKVQRDGADFTVYDEDGNAVKYEDFVPSASVDIVYKADAEEGKNYVLMPCEYNLEDGSLAVQDKGEEQEVYGADGKQLYYFETEDGLEIKKYVEYDEEGNVLNHVFELSLDSIFIQEVTTGGGSETVTTYTPLISDPDYYGKLYDISIATGNSGVKFEYGNDVFADAQYLSYMIPDKNAFGYWVITNAGEYAYMVINNFANPSNTDTYSIEGNIDFGGYAVVNIKDFYGKIEGNDHTVANMVITNKRLTENGVVEVNDSADTLNYSLFGDIKAGASLNRVFFVGMSLQEIDLEKLAEEVKNIYIAPLALNNYGSISRVVMQSDSIDVDSANIAGLVFNNYNSISNAQVYATLKGRNVAGVAYNNISMSADSFARLLNCGFYGDIECNIGEYMLDGVTKLYGAGLAVINETKASDGTVALVSGCESIGNITVNGEALEGVYAGGLVAVNSSTITRSYAGEFTLNNVYKSVVANGNNGYAGGFVAYNTGAITDCYSTGKASASQYAGGFVGLNEGKITSCYATGNTTVGGAYNGAFAGLSNGSIDKCVSYSTDTWAKDEYTDIFKSSEQLESIVGVLYPDGNAQMTLVSGHGFRNPLINGLIYTKEYTVSMLPGTDDVVAKGIFVGTDSQVTELEGVGDNIFGNNTKGSRVVVALSNETAVKYIYGTVR